MSGGGGSSSPEKTTQVQEPPAYLKPYLQQAANQAKNEFAQGATKPYKGSAVLDFNALQKNSMQGMLDTVNGSAYQDLNTSVADANTYALNLPQNIQTDETLKAIADANTANVRENLVENTLRDIRGQSIATGSYDSTRTGIAEGNAIEGAAEATADANARLYGDAYNNALKYSQVAQSQVPQIQQAMLQPHQIQGTVGDAYASLDQARTNEDINKYYEAQSAKANNIAEYISLLQGTNSGGTTTMTAPGQPKPSSASKILGAGMTGLGAYGMAAQAGLAATPIGWGAAAASLLL